MWIISALVAIAALALTALQVKAWRWFKKKPAYKSNDPDYRINEVRRIRGYIRSCTYDRLKYNLWLQRQRQHQSHQRGQAGQGGGV